MLSPLPIEDSRQLVNFFEEAGYTEVNLRKHLGAAELLSQTLRNEPRLLDKTRESTLLNFLLRWFWLGHAQPRESVSELMPGPFLKLLLDSGLVIEKDGSLIAAAMILPFQGFLVASDHPRAIEQGESEMVLWPNPTSKFLSRFAVHRHSRATLDLGTGSGILSLGAAKYSDRVTATDLNSRAVEFARFNARLNAVENVEVHVGDGFAPVSGQTFDLILCNPPFFITPKTDYMFCENPMELDQLCRRLVREAPTYLNEGGYMQMLCEWAQIKGQAWEDRVAEWLEGIGCDAWVMKGLTQNPEEYAQHRIRETTQHAGRDSELYEGYMDYYRDRGVEAIHDGMIVIRRRNGHNWMRIEEVPKTPNGDLGELVLSTFAAHDQLRELDTDDKLLAIKPKLAPHTRLEQICEQAGDRWRAEALTLRLISGFPFHVTIQPLVAEFLATCDGVRTADQAIQGLATAANAPLDTVRRECLGMIRRLIERGFMVVG